jgi:hypothetical protein
MKTKEVSVYLSLVAFVQTLILAFGGGLINEILKPASNKLLILILAALVLFVLLIGLVINLVLFNKISKRKK